ncbi:E3 ubiquitin-protein ligase TRIM39-like isoform X2 [Ambystoma mexicanum]|uniref:E3 ubiquitin-protein ligase TRIM39-like isoform X2 n=1 Tax=Ambystoma mexicanum TaxID=8296 RepID=UPI0037E99F6F
MAGANFEVLKEEATCSICLEYINDPVTIDCGHNFCRSCITHCCRKNDVKCPQCRQTSRRSLQSNCQLRNIVEMLKQQEKNMCMRHKQPLQLFCEEDQQMLCLVCRESKDHKTHTVSPLTVAAHDYKLKLRESLLSLKKQKEGVLETKQKAEQQHKTIMLDTEKQEIAAVVERLRELLQEKETILHQKSKTERKITRAENANNAELTIQIDTLTAQINELEEKCKEPAVELLKDVGNTLSRWTSGDLMKPTEEIKRKENIFKPLIIPKLNHEVKKCKVLVSLDPDTAHPELLLLGRRTRVKLAYGTRCLPENPKRFTACRAVMGVKGFTFGRYYWEVRIDRSSGWSVGVAAESVSRKESFAWSPEWGVWAMWSYDGMYGIHTIPETTLYPQSTVSKLGVYLDYGRRRLSLYNAETTEHLYTFSKATFSGPIFPFFCLENYVEMSLL